MSDTNAGMCTYRILRGSDDTVLYTRASANGISGVLHDARNEGITIDGVQFTPEGFVAHARFVTSYEGPTDVVTVRIYSRAQINNKVPADGCAPLPQDEVTP